MYAPENKLVFQDESNGTNDGMGIGFQDAGIMKLYSDASITFQESDEDKTKIIFDLNSASVGINTADIPSEYKLAVHGKIIGEEVKVSVYEQWPDYIFSEGYELTSLEETETFIQQNGHLPEVPSAQQVEEEGISLGEMNAILLKKIEELTLHVINIEKENKKLNLENNFKSDLLDAQQEQLNQLKYQVEQIKNKLNRL